ALGLAREPGADGRVNLFRLSGPGSLARPDRPDGLVRDRNGFVGPSKDIEKSFDLALDYAECLAALALCERLADADDRKEAAADRRRYLVCDDRVGLAEVLAPLAVAHNDPCAAAFLEEGTADLPGEGAFRLGIKILRRERDARAVDLCGDSGERGER